MTRWILYTAAGSCALATHIALHEAGVSFESKRLDMAVQQQQSRDYLAINPKGRVPALVTEHGVLTETPALLSFIAHRFPAAGLAPLDDPFALARFHEFNSYLASTVHIAHAHKRRGARWTDDAAAIDALRAYVPTSMAACAAALEAQLAGPWALGERYSAADGYLFTIAGWLEDDEVDLAAFPRLLAHRERVAARPAVQRALADLGQPANRA